MTRPYHRNVRVGATALGMTLLTLTLLAPPAAAIAPIVPDAGVWGVNGRVYSIVQTPDVIYLGGKFTAAVHPTSGATVARTNVVALSATTGAPLSFAPNPNKEVHDLALSPDGSVLYLGGDFSKLGATARKKVAAVNATTGAVTAWNPGVDLRVEAVATLGDRVYLGGKFTTVAGQLRTRLAAVSASTGALDPVWAPSADEAVHDIKITPDNRVLAGGLFTSINGSPGIQQRRLVALDPDTAALLPWEDHPQYEVFDIAISDSQVFTAAGGAGGHAMAYKLSTGEEQWVKFADGNLQGAAYQNGVAYFGGHFDTWEGDLAKKVVALDPLSGYRFTWDVKANTALGVWSMHSDGQRLALGGDFTKINTQAVNRFVRFTEPEDTEPPTAPGTPTFVSATYNDITIEWPVATDNAATNLLYRIYRDGGATPIGQVSSVAQSGTVEFTDTDNLPGDAHTYRVTADDGTFEGPASAESDLMTSVFTEIPQLVRLEAFDDDTDARVDRVDATFSHAVICDDPCLTPWDLDFFPTGTTLSSVSVAGRVASLTLAEGTGVQSTVVGNAKVNLTASATGIRDVDGDQAAFGNTSPLDRMSPIALVLLSSNVGVAPGVMEPGDTFTVKFSEAIDPDSVIAANGKQTDPSGAGNDTMTLVGLTNGAIDIGSDDYVTPDGGSIVYLDSQLALQNDNKNIKSTIVGSCSGTACGQNGPGATAPVTFAPEPTLRDPFGNPAAGTLVQVLQLF